MIIVFVKSANHETITFYGYSIISLIWMQRAQSRHWCSRHILWLKWFQMLREKPFHRILQVTIIFWRSTFMNSITCIIATSDLNKQYNLHVAIGYPLSHDENVAHSNNLQLFMHLRPMSSSYNLCIFLHLWSGARKQVARMFGWA